MSGQNRRLLVGALFLLLVCAGSAQTLTSLVQFNGTNGNGPGGLVQGLDGNFYGVTYDGGTDGFAGNGTVFKVTADGVLSTLYNFCVGGDPCPDGKHPSGTLVQDASGNLYGATAFGGLYQSLCTPRLGCGTIFKITPSGQLTVLYYFCSQTKCSDGATPSDGFDAGLAFDSAGNSYGRRRLQGQTVLEVFSGCRQLEC